MPQTNAGRVPHVRPPAVVVASPRLKLAETPGAVTLHLDRLRRNDRAHCSPELHRLKALPVLSGALDVTGEPVALSDRWKLRWLGPLPQVVR